jgi:hypothetical protein
MRLPTGQRPRVAYALGLAVLGALLAALVIGFLYIQVGGKPSTEPAVFAGLLLNAGLLGAAVFGAVPVLQQTLSAAAAAEASRGGVDLQATAEVLYGDWIAGRFDDDEHLRLFGQEADTLRQGRAQILADLRRVASESDTNPAEIQTWWVNWIRLTAYNSEGGHRPPEAQFCFHAADRLEFVGLMCFAGAIPLRIVLAGMANVVVQDWLLSENWVKTYYQSVPLFIDVTVDGHTERVHFQRCHAEWLAAIATIWVRRYLKTLDLLDELGPESGRASDGTEALARRVSAVSVATGPIMLPSVRRDIRELIGVEVPDK